MAKIINMHEAKTHLSRLADEVRETGEPIIIAKAGAPWVQVVAVAQKKPVIGARAREWAALNTEELDALDAEISEQILGKA